MTLKFTFDKKNTKILITKKHFKKNIVEFFFKINSIDKLTQFIKNESVSNQSRCLSIVFIEFIKIKSKKID
jgi:hypothetical protein